MSSWPFFASVAATDDLVFAGSRDKCLHILDRKSGVIKWVFPTGLKVDSSPVGESYRQKTLLYRNSGNGRFMDVTAEAGPGFVPLRPSRGLAVGDLDGDGRPEIVIVNMNERPSILKNLGRRQNSKIQELGYRCRGRFGSWLDYAGYPQSRKQVAQRHFERG